MERKSEKGRIKGGRGENELNTLSRTGGWRRNRIPEAILIQNPKKKLFYNLM